MRGAEVLVESVRDDRVTVSDATLLSSRTGPEATPPKTPVAHPHAGSTLSAITIYARVNSELDEPTPDSAGLRLRNLGFLMGSTVIRDTACAESLVDRSAAAV